MRVPCPGWEHQAIISPSISPTVCPGTLGAQRQKSAGVNQSVMWYMIGKTAAYHPAS